MFVRNVPFILTTHLIFGHWGYLAKHLAGPLISKLFFCLFLAILLPLSIHLG